MKVLIAMIATMSLGFATVTFATSTADTNPEGKVETHKIYHHHHHHHHHGDKQEMSMNKKSS